MRNRTAYPALRSAIKPEQRWMSDRDVEGIIADSFPGADPDYVEDLMKSLTQVAQVAAPIAQKALPGMIQGAVQGATVAGPYGAIAGAVAGGAISAMKPDAPKAQPAAPAAAPAAPAAAPAAPAPARQAAAPRPAAPAAPQAPAARVTPGQLNAAQMQAARQLLALLARPETIQALHALALGVNGRSHVGTAARPVPSRSVAEAIAETAQMAAGLSHGPAPQDRLDETAYRTRASGRPRLSEAVDSPTATLVLTDFTQSPGNKRRRAQRRAARRRVRI